MQRIENALCCPIGRGVQYPVAIITRTHTALPCREFGFQFFPVICIKSHTSYYSQNEPYDFKLLLKNLLKSWCYEAALLRMLCSMWITTSSWTVFALAHYEALTLRAICSIDSEVMSNEWVRFSGHTIMQKLHVDNTPSVKLFQQIWAHNVTKVAQ